MKTIGLTEDGDLDFNIVQGHDEIIQCIVIELKSALAEWFEDLEYGIDKSLFTDKPYPQEVAAEVTRVIANESRVELDGTVNVAFDQTTRTAHIAFVVRKIDDNELLPIEVSI